MTGEEGVRPADIWPAAESTVTQPVDVDRIRRRWRLHQQFVTRRAISRALDRHLGVGPIGPAEVDYDAMGFTLDWAERRSAA